MATKRDKTDHGDTQPRRARRLGARKRAVQTDLFAVQEPASREDTHKAGSRPGRVADSSAGNSGTGARLDQGVRS